MTRYVAFLRGMNVGGHRIANSELCAAFEEIGLPDAATFRASGNVIFDAPDGGRRSDIAAKIEQGLEQALGYAVPVFLRDAAETRAIAAHEPFPAKQVDASKGKLQVVLLASKPSAKTTEDVLAHASDKDRLAIEGSELYWLPSGGTLDSELDLKAIAKLLGGLSTMRTKGTVDLIAAKHCAE
ncbi:MAG TPA: DUF1697 domain-containing protein [Thermoleophilaceae bacterium]|nr:DUF1697 domain-containing protein [Thermoleophilaceae bacterium]